MIKGKGKTDFIEKKYLSKHTPTSYEFERYANYISDSNADKLGKSPNEMINQANLENDILLNAVQNNNENE